MGLGRTGKILLAAIISAAMGLLVGRGYFLLVLARGHDLSYSLVVGSATRAGGGFFIISFSFLLQRIYSKPRQ